MRVLLFIGAIWLISCSTPPTGKADPIPKADSCEFHIYVLKSAAGLVMGYVKVAQHVGLYAADQAAVRPFYWDVKNGSYNIDSIIQQQQIKH